MGFEGRQYLYLKVNFDNLNCFLDCQNRCLDKQNWLREYQNRFLDYHWFGNYRIRIWTIKIGMGTIGIGFQTIKIGLGTIGIGFQAIKICSGTIEIGFFYYQNWFGDYENCFGDYRNRFCGQAARSGGLCCGSLAAASPSPCITSRKRKRNLKSSRNMFPWNGLLGCWHHIPGKEI